MIISKREFEDLALLQEEPSLSMFIPTFRADKNETSKLKWKNLCKNAANELEKSGYGRKLIDTLIGPAKEKLEQPRFWNELSDGYCYFASRRNHFAYALPVHFESAYFISDRFLISPLLSYFSERQRFFLLLLSKQEVRFYEGNKHSITPVKIDDLVPQDSKMSSEPASLQYHTAGGQAIFHGENSGDEERIALEKYFRDVDQGLLKMLHDEQVPMVLAGVEHLIPVFRDISGYNHIEDDFIRGNVMEDDPVLLHEKAWEIIQRQNRKEKKIHPVSFDELMKREKASADLDAISNYAQEGRVETLYFHENFYKDQDPDNIWKIHTCLIDAWNNGSEIQIDAGELMPKNSAPLNALLRY